MTDHIFPVLPIRDLINESREPTKTFQLATGTRPSVSHWRVIFCTYVVRKATAHVDKMALNIRQQAQKGFCGIFVGIPQHQKGYLVYILGTRKIISSYDVFLWKFFYYIRIYVTTLCRRDGYASDCVIHTLCYIFKGINWRYNHTHTVWRGKFIIWNLWRCRKWWQTWRWFKYATINQQRINGCGEFSRLIWRWTCVNEDVRINSWR